MKDDSGSPPDVDPIARLLGQAGPRAAAPAEREARVRAAVRAHWRAEVDAAARKRRLAWAAAIVAAAAAVAFVIGRGWWSREDRSPGAEESIATLLRAEGSVHLAGGGPLKHGDTLAPGGEIETGQDGRAALSLSEGSSLRLDSGTRVRLAAGPILQLERGSVYIDSGVSRARRAFLEVRTKLGVVRDIGTQFEVRLREDELWVSVREGLATLARGGRSFAAPAGTRLVAGATGEVQSRAVPVLGPDWDWVLAIAPEFRI
ncbi:MAG: FecR domain-containing protein, partial [Acidobacteria bacterium]|nr:FecR domain-containing protein [Acidobacteriota bacterium]